MITIEQNKCTGCGRCVRDCVAENLVLKDGKAAACAPCLLCGHCVAICPEEAVSIPSYDMQDVEVFDKVRFGFDIGNLLYTIKARRSIRQYETRPIEREKLEAIVQAGRYTATAVNRQACRFILVQDELSAFKDLIWRGVESVVNTDVLPAETITAFNRFLGMRMRGKDYLFRDAPALIYIAAENKIDAGLAAQNMEMAAIAQRMGVLYNGFLVYAAQSNPEAREWLDVRDKPLAVCMLVGYPRVSYERTAPRRIADVRWR